MASFSQTRAASAPCPAAAWNKHWHSAAQRAVRAGLVACDAAYRGRLRAQRGESIVCFMSLLL